MYIEPQTNIKLLSNVPIDNTYEHTLYFATAASQAAYFMTKAKYNLSAYTYQRVTRGVCRVGIVADNLYDCNYMMFQNSAFGNKWFYAFITSIDYVNNVTSELHYEIDVMQTWLLQIKRNECFIDREHTPTDEIGEHIEPEPVDPGEYVYNNYGNLFPKLSENNAVIVAITDLSNSDDADSTSGNLYDGIYGGATLWAFNASDVDGINDKISAYVQSPDSIVGLYMCPRWVATFDEDTALPKGGKKIPMRVNSVIETKTYNTVTKNTTLDGYKPKNMKLLTYPYNYFCAGSTTGSTLALRYEFFKNGDGTLRAPTLRFTGTITQPVQVLCRPLYYKGSGTTENMFETSALSNYPMCSWNVDSYKAWVAQNSVLNERNMIVKPLESVANNLMAGKFLNAVTGGLTSALDQVYSTANASYTASIQADQYRGSQTNGSGNMGNHNQGFFGGRISVTHQYARMIDSFFTQFGYSVRTIGIPPINNRPHWTYVKTAGANLQGNIPGDDLQKICSLFDKGLTFWRNPSEVGNYTLDNSPA